MPKVGSTTYPYFKLSRAVEIVRRICEPPYKGEISVGGLAQELKMAEKGGGFLYLVSTLRDYGLVAGTGTLQATDIAKRIVAGTPEEAGRARAEAFLKVELFGKLKEKIGTEVPDLERFSVILRDQTSADALKVKESAETIRNLYLEGIPYLRSQTEPGMEVSPAPTPGPQTQSDKSASSISTDFARLESEDFVIQVRKDTEAIDFAESQIRPWLAHVRKKLAKEEKTE